jgi:hypothetical protein
VARRCGVVPHHTHGEVAVCVFSSTASAVKSGLDINYKLCNQC